MIKIDNKIPIPAVNQRRVSKSKYPLHEMEVGDSFFVKATGSGVNPVGSLAYYVGIRSGKKFSARKTTEGGVDGFRIWRVK